MSKNQPNDPRINCKPPSNLVHLIERDLNFEEKLKAFQGHKKKSCPFQPPYIMKVGNITLCIEQGCNWFSLNCSNI